MDRKAIVDDLDHSARHISDEDFLTQLGAMLSTETGAVHRHAFELDRSDLPVGISHAQGGLYILVANRDAQLGQPAARCKGFSQGSRVALSRELHGELTIADPYDFTLKPTQRRHTQGNPCTQFRGECSSQANTTRCQVSYLTCRGNAPSTKECSQEL
jgi:hypothetical protein